MNYNNFHSDFKLNGNSFSSVKEILLYTQYEYSEITFFLEKWFDSSKYLTVSTSGSTGKPKSIELKKEFMANSAKATGDFFDLPNKTTALSCLPIKYIAGKMMMVRALVLGWRLDLVEPSSKPIDSIDKFYDFSAMVPLQLFNSLNKINHVKKLIIGGGIVSKDLQSNIMDLPTKIYATYGMTETITHIAIKPLNKASGLIFDKDVYQTLPNINISTDNRNCLVIDAPKVSNEILITTDIIKLVSDDKFKWLGRYDNIVNSGGIKIIPEQIEEKLTQLISQRFFVTGLPDANLGEKLVLIIEGDSFKLNKEDFKVVLTKYEIPKEIFFLKKFIETDTGKIKRKEIIDIINS